MKFIGFAATYSPETNEITNKHNYFMNGIIKDDVGESSYADVSRISQPRSLYALADGSKSAGQGEDVAYLCMNMMNDVLGRDFNIEQKDYFDSAHDIVKGRVLQENGLDMAVDMGVLYFFGNEVRAYNVGNVSIYQYSDDKLIKISGKMPESVEVDEIFEEGRELKVETTIKPNVPHIGYFMENSEIAPYISENIRLNKTSSFIMTSESVTDIVSDEEILAVLSDENIVDDEKAAAIINIAVEKNPEGNYTVEIIKAKAPLRILGIRIGLLATILAVVLGISGLFAFPGIGSSVQKGFSEFLMQIMYGDESSIVEVEGPWVPLEDDEEDAEPEKDEEESEAKEEPQQVQKPVTPQPKPANPAPKPSVTQNENGSTGGGNTTIKEEKPVAPPPPVENNDVELPIDFD